MLIHKMRDAGSVLIVLMNTAQAYLHTAHKHTVDADAWAIAGAVQLQAQCAASAPRVPHPGVPGQVLLPPHGHHEQACLRCHTDALSPQACPGLRFLPPTGVLLHLAHYQGMLYAIRAFCTPLRHVAHYQGMLHAIRAFCTLLRHVAHYQGMLHAIRAFCTPSGHIAHYQGILHTMQAFCTLSRHVAHYQGILHTIKAFRMLPRRVAHYQGVLHTIKAFCT